MLYLKQIIIKESGIMQKVVYLKEPGYVQDLFFAFILYHNKEVVTEKFVLKNKAAADTKFYKEALERFEPFDEDLLPFFYLTEDAFCFMSVKYFRDFDFLENFSFRSVLERLNDKPALIKNMMQFYFNIEDNYSNYSLLEISGCIKDLPYSDALKYHLALFFMNPEHYIDKLTKSLAEKELILRKYYNDRSDDIFETQAKVDVQDVLDSMNFSIHKRTFSYDQVYYSINLIEKNHLSYANTNNALFFFLGSDFQDQLNACLDSRTPPDMVQWGKIYSEENRITILRLLKENGELCTSDIAQRIGLSPTAVYYHLEMMFDAKMLASRNEGRTIFYSINKDYFKRASEALKEFIEA